ncbi:response regulator transcription factor [Methylophilaceae bacterium]|nr:response regulator transcription factor [Methylophilaceae bacterium]
MKRLLIIDDHEVVRSGLKRLLENNKDISHIAECASGEEAYSYLYDNEIHIIIMDISMPGKGGIEATQQIKKRYPEIKIIILSMHDNPMMVTKAISAGANAYILKNEISDNLLDALDKLIHGSSLVTPSVKFDNTNNILKLLSDKEFEIFISISNGEDLKKIGKNLNISYKSVANYQTSIKKKLSIKNALDFYNLAKENNLLN